METEKIVAEIIRIWEKTDVKWDDTMGEMSECFGALGTMSPLNRMAFVRKFGETLTAECETQARQVIAAREAWFKGTKYHEHELEADNHKGALREGCFVWCMNSGLKQDGGGGAYDELTELVLNCKGHRRLCKVDAVYLVGKEDFSRRELADELVVKYKLHGGDLSEDLQSDADFHNLSDVQLRTYYTHGSAVVCIETGKWYLIDSQNYDYARYIYLPDNWRDMFASEVEIVLAKEAARKAEEERQEAEAKAERLREYQERCAKWKPLMTDVRPLIEEELKAYNKFKESGYKKGSAEHKAYKSAQLRTNNARKANIMAMVRTAFPNVKFRLITQNDWGATYRLEWTDAMTVDEFNEATDIVLFEHGHNWFDGMTDSSEYAAQEFTEFADFTMGENMTRGDIELERHVSDDAKSKAVAALKDLGVTAENWQTRWTEAHKIKGCEEVSTRGGCWEFSDFIWRIANCMHLYDKPEHPSKAQPKRQVQGEFQLIEYSEKAVAVVGDTKAVKDQLKELGGRFNGKLTCGAGWVFPKSKVEQLKKLLGL